MTLNKIVEIFGDGYFKLCEGKRAIDSNLYGADQAQRWLDGGGTLGLWCPKGFVIVDIDDREQAEILNRLTRTLKCRTPHGMHFYFRTDKEIRQVVKAHTPIGLRIDTRTADKGYCVLPFGCSDREWVNGELEDIPDWILPLSLSSKAPEYILVGAKDGDGRNDSLIRHVMRLRKEGYEGDSLKTIVSIINQYIWSEPMEQTEIDGILSNASEYTPYEKQQNKVDFCLYNENGNVSGINHKALVDYMVAHYPMFTLGKNLYFYKDGVFTPNELEVKDIIKTLILAPKYQKQSQIKEIYGLLQEDIRLVWSDDRCNQYKNFLNFKNGMFDVESQQLYPHDPRYFSTIQIQHEYIPNDLSVDDIQLMDFFKQTKLPKDDIDMLLNYMAYSMTVDNTKKCFMCLVGGSNTGKSTLINVVNAIVGKRNNSSLSIHDMSQRFYPAQLKDKLTNTCADNSSDSLNDIANLKKITGNDEIMYEDKGGKPYFFLPFSKLWFSFNTLPLQLEEKSDAYYERMRIAEMNNKVILTQRYVDDLISPESISAVIPILCRRLKGLKKIKPSKNSLALVNRLRAESDSIHAFVTTQIERTGNYADYVAKDELYESYSRFCMREDRIPNKRMMFYRQLEVLGMTLMKNGNQEVYVGLKKL